MSRAEKKDLFVPDHSHCTMCTRPVPLNQWFCSDECESKYKVMAKKRRTRSVLIMFLAFLPLVVLLILSVLSGM